MTSLQQILFDIDTGDLTLPKFQRGYVWQRNQVRELMRSLYAGFPVGSFLVWKTSDQRGGKSRIFLLDGQQRITSLYGVICGKKPAFSDCDPKAFENLYFNLHDEAFEFYSAKMSGDSHWIEVTDLLQSGSGKYLKKFVGDPNLPIYIDRLGKISGIKGRLFHVETVSGDDKDMDTVVDIFNQVNSGGTKLSKGDLAMAKVSANWHPAREEMHKRLSKWSGYGYNFSLDWLLRCINALVTRQSNFEFIAEVSADRFQDGLGRAEKHIDSALAMLRNHLGLVDSSVLRSPNSIPAIISYFDKINGVPDSHQQSRMLYWYVFSALRGRYSSAAETAIRQDLVAIAENDDPVSTLISSLQEYYGDLKLTANTFDAATARSRFFPMLYMMTCVFGAKDLCTGFKLSKGAIGAFSNLERHHLFPKSQLRKHGIRNNYEVNALANFTWLTRPCNRPPEIGNRLPEEYFPHYETKHPGVLASHWIPMDERLWKIENYRDFLAARRELLAEAANNFLDQLYHGSMPEADAPQPAIEPAARSRPVSIASDEEEAALQKAMEWMKSKSLPPGEYGYELVAPDGELLATLDLAWPRGIQEGYSRQAALLINESEETRNIAEDHDYKCFTSLSGLQHYVQDEILGEPETV